MVKIGEGHLENALKTLQGLNITPDQISEPIDPFGTRVIKVQPEKLADVLAALQSNPDITNVEPNYLVSMAALPPGYPNDPQYPNQANLNTVQVHDAWDTLSIDVNPGEPVVVAVLDTGVDSTHEDLSGRIWTNPGETSCTNGVDDDHNGYVDDCNGWDMVNRDNNPSDDNGHGTEMAGVIGAVTNNATGIAGIAPNARLMPVKVLDSRGVGTHSDASEGIIYAANMGARIINIGFAGRGNSDVLRNAITYALSKGVIIVAPAGNDGGPVDNYPASYAGVISVSAVNNDTTIAGFSTRSNYISLAAPGVNILSTAPGNNYRSASGTSLAAAHVSGVSAMLAGQPQFINQPELLLTAMFSSALDLGPAGHDMIYGYGLLRANTTLAYVIISSTVQINTPPDSSVYAQGQTITFTGIALDAAGNNISSSLVWTSNIDGQIGTGASFTTSHLTPGAHTITAAVSGGSALVNIRVLESSGPHGEFTVDTSSCIECHTSHSDNGLDAASAGSSNDYCMSCHNGARAKAVSTHSNLSSGVAALRQEQPFELLCIQCHDPHGSTNLFAIRTNFYLGTLPTHFHSMFLQASLISFPLLNASNLNNLCISCHQDPANPGFPMTSHDGGETHNDGDYSNQICISCHYHDFDGNPYTKDGFMPALPMAVTIVATGSPTPVTTPTPELTQAVTATFGRTPAATLMPTETPIIIETPVR